ncbi:MAG: TonB-dependent receptor plug domain-containing protein [Reinekea sp.]|nr:TonB-dependent receptor plug domain-containing protein [Reinekea sp.]
MSHMSMRAYCLLSILASSFSFSEPDSDTLFEPVYSEFIPAYDANAEFATTSVTVLKPDQFSASNISIADVIELAPSVQIQNTGETGSYASVSVRGAPSQQTQIYIDGVLQPSVGGEGGYLQQISASEIERIEIFPGSLPLQFSQATPGGAINIVLKKTGGTGARVLLETGSFGHLRGAMSGRGQLSTIQLSGFAEAVNIENDFSYVNDHGTTLYTGDDERQTRNNANFNSLQGSLTAEKKTQDTQAVVTVDALSSRKNLPHWNNAEAIETYYAKQHIGIQGAFSQQQWGPGLDSSLRWQSRFDQGHFSDPSDLIGIYANDSVDHLRSHQLSHHSVYAMNSGQFVMSNEWHDHTFAIEDSLQQFTLDASRQQYNNSLGFEWFASSAQTLSATVRHLYFVDQQSEQKTNVNDWGWQIGTRHDGEDWHWQANAQRSVRHPNLIERFGNLGTFEGNDELRGESAFVADGTLGFNTDRLSAQSSIFYRATQDAIAPVYNSQGIGRYINLDSAIFMGAEWQLSTGFQSVKLISSGTVQQGMAFSVLDLYDRKQVPGFYPVATQQRLDWALSDELRMAVDYRYESGLFFDRANSTQAPDKHQVDVDLSWTHQHIRTSLNLQNVLNRAHVDFSRMPLPGRKITLTFEYRLGSFQ